MEISFRERKRKIIFLITFLVIMLVGTAALNFYLQYKRKQFSSGWVPAPAETVSFNRESPLSSFPAAVQESGPSA